MRKWHNYPSAYPSLGNQCDCDLSIEIIGLLNNEFAQASLSFHHVRGHQDEKKPWDDLTWAEQLNVNCDQRATSVLCSLTNIDQPSTGTLKYNSIDVTTDNIPITNKLAQTIRNAYSSRDMRPYLCKKFSWSSSTCNLVDWLCLGCAVNQLTNNVHIFIVKLIHEWLPTHSHKHRSNRRHSHKCPICSSPNKTNQHFLRCDHDLYRPSHQ